MFRAQKKRALERTNFGKEVVREQDYPDRLNMYLIPPLAEITLDQFEEWALDRLRVLSEIETCLFRNRNMKMTEQTVKPLLEKYLPLSPNAVSGRVSKGSQLDDERKKDHYSHFILRLAFCRTDDLRRRFVKAETVLFRIRYTSADITEQHALLTRYNFGWTPVSDDEKRSLKDFLTFSSSESTYATSSNETYFKVPFERVPELIESRKVFLKDGVAYVPASKQLSLILTEFSEKLERALEVTARALPRLDEDDRLLPILAHLSKGFVAPEYIPDNSTTGGLGHGVVRAAQVDSLVPHFPLCMRTLHSALRRDSHLRYFGRQQYGLFLKGIGLSVEEALTFWRTSFSTCTDEKFGKEYRYNIRHNYGLEGNRRNYKPRSCAQILTDAAPGANEHHGCPYRQFSEDNLVAAIQGLGVSDQGVLRGVRDDVRNKQYHVACTRVFEATHKAVGAKSTVGVGVGMETVTHPNLYFDRSMQFAKQVEAVEGESGK
ncbi:eukaryotic and archaeal DNA primase, large subunit-domain-containing protein [Lipomyces orientalis]|uniref:Eukaryotic and archaeal DNA primase, large subunit-domain-containing protein n=1 Tax=Lipomyces orientalis TaxID=1233043 RepID=A0ACC3TNF0_9ASCO